MIFLLLQYTLQTCCIAFKRYSYILEHVCIVLFVFVDIYLALDIFYLFVWVLKATNLKSMWKE